MQKALIVNNGLVLLRSERLLCSTLPPWTTVLQAVVTASMNGVLVRIRNDIFRVLNAVCEAAKLQCCLYALIWRDPLTAVAYMIPDVCITYLTL